MNFIGDSETDSMAFRVSLPVATIILMMLLTPSPVASIIQGAHRILPKIKIQKGLCELITYR